jgi:hypothetical protein
LLVKTKRKKHGKQKSRKAEKHEEKGHQKK